MATAYLGIQESAFWMMTPKEYVARLEAWQDIEKSKRNDLAVKIALWMHGKNPDSILGMGPELTADQVFDML